MKKFDFQSAFHKSFSDTILTIDSHVGGEAARMVIGGLPPIKGKTTNDKRVYISENLDYVRQLVTREPRGHRDMFGSIMVEPESPQAAFGLVYIEAEGYPYLCGHATIAAVSATIELGLLEVQIPQTTVVVDTPSGPFQTVAHVCENPNKDGRPYLVNSVAIQPEISFAYLLDQTIDVPGFGNIQLDVAFTGNFFAMVSVDQLNFDLTHENLPRFIDLGLKILEASNAQLEVNHPQRPYIHDINMVEFFDPRGHKEHRGKNYVVLGEGHVDRSPCGTGTCAKLALLHQHGNLGIDELFVNEGLTGTTFDARIVRTTSLKDPTCGTEMPAIIPEVRGKAHITGFQQFILTPEDPFPEGFLI
jgi:proline racemase